MTWIDQALERDERMAIEAPLLDEIAKYQKSLATIRCMAKDMADGRLSRDVMIEWCDRIVKGIDTIHSNA